MAIRQGPAITLLAIAFHSIIVAASLVPGWHAEPLVSGDAVTYLVPARSLLATGHFSRESGPDPAWEPYRTPGYPLVLAASLALTGGVAAALFASCATAGLAAWSAARLATEWGGGTTAAWSAGLLVAFLPNSVGLSARLLTDAMFAHLFLFWLLLSWRAMTSGSLKHLAGSTMVCVALQALKPTFNIAPVLILLVAAAAGAVRSRWRTLALLLVLSLPTPLYFAFQNLRDHGVFTPSLLGTDTFRQYLQVRALAAEAGIAEAEMAGRLRLSDREAAARLSFPPSKYGRLYLVQSAAARGFVRTHPLRTAWLMATEALRQFLAPQEFVVQVFLGDLPAIGRAAGSVLTLGIWCLAAFGGRYLWKEGVAGPTLLVMGVFVVFVGAGSISHRVGGRLRLPADMAAAPLFGLGIAQVAQARTSRSGAFGLGERARGNPE
jgi:hypothetical protein